MRPFFFKMHGYIFGYMNNRKIVFYIQKGGVLNYEYAVFEVETACSKIIKSFSPKVYFLDIFIFVTKSMGYN